jgi:hypothetical protein
MSRSKFAAQKGNEQYYDVHTDALRRVHKDQRIFYVDSNYSGDADNWSGRRLTSAKPTITSAYSDCTAARGDTILVEPFHAETTTAVLTMSTSYVQLEGVQIANRRPEITLNGAVDMFSVEAAGQSIKNIEQTIVTTDAATALINVAAADCHIDNVKMIPSATAVNTVDCITLASGGDDLELSNLQIYNTVVAVNSFINIEAAVARLKLHDSHMFGDIVTAGIIDAAAATQVALERNVIGTIGTTIPGVTLDSNPTGFVDDLIIYGTHTTLTSNYNFGNLLRLSRIRVCEETDASVQASDIIPVLDTN